MGALLAAERGMTNYVLDGLVKRRAEVAGEIEALHERIRKLLANLDSLDATIGQFDPTYRVEEIRAKAFRPPKDWAHPGQMLRLVMSIMRQAAEPMTTRDVALQMLVERALDKNDLKLLRLMTKRVGVVLRRQREAGFVQADQGPGQYMLWEIAR
jgi:hypothetical protein